MLLWQIYIACNNKTYVGLHVKVPDFVLKQKKVYEIITPTNTPKNIYNFILKNPLHVSALLGHLRGE
jgi:hypothetical protein